MITEPKTNEEAKKRKIQVVRELPTQEIRTLENKETGEIIEFITTEEALALLLNKK